MLKNFEEFDKSTRVDESKIEFISESSTPELKDADGKSIEKGSEYIINWDGKQSVIVKDVFSGDLDGKFHDVLVSISKTNAKGEEDDEMTVPGDEFLEMIINN